MKWVISSGKGGTGKTFIATNLAFMLAERGRDVTYLDCDVEEPNGHLFLKPQFDRTERMTVRSPMRIDAEQCIACGKCVEVCRYNALAMVREKVLLFDELCHACGACAVVCPVDAVVEGDKDIGELRHGRAGKMAFHDGLTRTGVGGMSPRLIHALKTHAGDDVTILDSPPGTACTAVEAVKDSDLCMLVADPTPFALWDLKLSVNMCREIGVEPVVVVNRAGLDDADLRDYCTRAQLEIVGEIPDSRRIAEVYSVGDLVAEKLPEFRVHFERILERAFALTDETRPAKRDLIERPFTPGGDRARAATRDVDAVRPPEVVIISGKGGTGKTTIAACFAQLNAGGVVADCDVDAADLHLVLSPESRESGDFVGGVSAEIDQARCTRCGKCFEHCRFDAIERTDDDGYRIDAVACEGCGVCALVCEADAVRVEDAVNGKWFVGSTRFGPMSHAMLGFAEENSGRLVTLVRDNAMALAPEGKTPVVIDGSPGTGCPVIASVTGARYAVIVTEPTVSGLHDMERVLALTRHFGVSAGVIVNKADLNADMTAKIRDAAAASGAETLGEVPYHDAFTHAQIARKTLLEYDDGEVACLLCTLWDKIAQRLA